MSVGITWLGHASVLIEHNNAFRIYIDPWKVASGSPKADIILVTHEHFDHYDEADILQLTKDSTRVIAPMSKARVTDILQVGNSLKIGDVLIETVPAYNLNKEFHPKAQGWVGYIVTVDSKLIYHTGDTDHIPEMKSVQADVVCIPVGGTYTMDVREAAEALNDMRVSTVMPMHFGDIVGTREDALLLPGLTSRTVHVLQPGECFTLD